MTTHCPGAITAAGSLWTAWGMSAKENVSLPDTHYSSANTAHNWPRCRGTSLKAAPGRCHKLSVPRLADGGSSQPGAQGLSSQWFSYKIPWQCALDDRLTETADYWGHWPGGGMVFNQSCFPFWWHNARGVTVRQQGQATANPECEVCHLEVFFMKYTDSEYQVVVAADCWDCS